MMMLKKLSQIIKLRNWPKDVDENLKDEIEFILKSNEALDENKIKNKIEESFLKYRNGNNIHKHGKQLNE